MRSFVWTLAIGVISTNIGISGNTGSMPYAQPERLDQLQTSQLEETPQTLLRFETQHYLVRVYRIEGLTYLNVFNKETGFTDRNRALVTLEPPESNDNPWWTYINVAGDLEYRARVNPEGRTELEIRLAGEEPAQPEIGYNASYGFPHQYLGQDIEQTLEELEESGWEIDFSKAEEAELTFNQLALKLKFDPETGIVNYTQLIDLT